MNMTSLKKSDNMCIYTDMHGKSVGQFIWTPSVTIDSSKMAPGQFSLFIWSPTARLMNVENGSVTTGVPAGAGQDQSARTSSRVFYRGLRESVNVNIADGSPWEWRRIVIAGKGLGAYLTQLVIGLNTAPMYYFESIPQQGKATHGYGRVVTDFASNANSSSEVIASSLISRLFRGVNDIDWCDVMIAKTDKARNTVLYDRLRSITSGNDHGVNRRYKHWIPMNKTAVYDEDEVGSKITNSPWTTVADYNQLGDVFVLDFIRPQCVGTTVTPSVMQWTPQATLYWHEGTNSHT